jgi:hypothetical protein
MTNVRSWKFWVIIALALTTLACAGRRERREQAREDRRDRAEQRRMEREARNEPRRTERSRQSGDEVQTAPAAQPAPQATQSTQAATFQPISTAPSAAAGPDAKVVFVRPTYFVGDPIPASVFDVTDPGEAKFIGILNRKTRVEYPVKPGLHTFMIVSEAADFLQAHIVGGKTYYALVTPRPGAWRARFSLVPVRQNEQRVQKWEEEIPLVANTARTLDWARKNARSVEGKRDKYWPEWSSKPEDQRLAQTLMAEDGR